MSFRLLRIDGSGTSASTKAGRLGQAVLRRSPPSVRGAVSRAAWRTYERYLAIRGGSKRLEAPDGLPLPPAKLRVLVARSPDPGYFLNSGAMEAEAIRGLARKHGAPVEEMGAILDFGCGCGRVARHWARDGVAVCGCDYNGELVDWCGANLAFVDARRNALAPPLPFDGPFDLIYAISVFTHLTAPMQHAWIRELHRALSPAGLLLFTTLGRRYLDRLDDTERRNFGAGHLVTRFDEAEGSNLCVAYHPEPFLERMLVGFTLEESVVTGVAGVSSNSPLSHQDVHVARKREQA